MGIDYIVCKSCDQGFPDCNTGGSCDACEACFCDHCGEGKHWVGIGDIPIACDGTCKSVMNEVAEAAAEENKHRRPGDVFCMCMPVIKRARIHLTRYEEDRTEPFSICEDCVDCEQKQIETGDQELMEFLLSLTNGAFASVNAARAEHQEAKRKCKVKEGLAKVEKARARRLRNDARRLQKRAEKRQREEEEGGEPSKKRKRQVTFEDEEEQEEDEQEQEEEEVAE
jgi:hypothetical protein